MIRIFTIATNVYKEYFERYFIQTVNRIFKDYKKEIILFSDGLEQYNNMIYDNTIVHVKHLYDLYVFDVQFNKFNFINQEIDKYKDDDLCLYIDSDTMFCENSLAEQKILNTYNDGNVHITTHPIFTFESIFNPNYKEERKNVYENKDTYGIFVCTPKDDKSEMITSFMYFSKSSFKKFFDIYNDYIYAMNSSSPRILPNLNDEGIINYMYNNDIGNIYGEDMFMTMNLDYNEDNEFSNNIIYIPWHSEALGLNSDSYVSINEPNFVICNQKFNYNIKNKKKFNMK